MNNNFKNMSRITEDISSVSDDIIKIVLSEPEKDAEFQKTVIRPLKIKIEYCKLLTEYCRNNQIEMHWLRIFNMYGTKQASNWIIPAVMNRCLNGEKEMDTTKGEQKYAYLYAEDFGKAVVSMFGVKGVSGIYNISSSNPISLKELQRLPLLQVSLRLHQVFLLINNP